MNKLLARLARLCGTGWRRPRLLWPPIQTAYAFVHRAAHLLANPDDLDRPTLQQRYAEQVSGPAEPTQGQWDRWRRPPPTSSR